MAKAALHHHSKLTYPDGAIREMILWQLPTRTPDRPHGLKYRLYYGRADGAWCASEAVSEPLVAVFEVFRAGSPHRHDREKHLNLITGLEGRGMGAME